MSMYKLGNKIKELRTSCNISEDQMAEKMGIETSRYLLIEYGILNISYKDLCIISEEVGVSIPEITKDMDNDKVDLSDIPEESSIKKIFEMLDLFYANERLYKRMRSQES